MKKAGVFLVILGLAQMTGDLLEKYVHAPTGRVLKGVGAATTAAPAPKVFSSVRGLETYSTRFSIEWTDSAGIERSLSLTPEIYGRIRGLYNRRNVYGAVLAYGLVLPESLRDPVMRYALCNEASLLRELGIDPEDIAGSVRIHYEPLSGSDLGELPRRLEAPCP